jgi:hypothetical protein
MHLTFSRVQGGRSVNTTENIYFYHLCQVLRRGVTYLSILPHTHDQLASLAYTSLTVSEIEQQAASQHF